MTAQTRSRRSANPLRQLGDCGQAVWLDFLSRRFIAEGRLASLITQDDLAGVTSNPSIFEKAIGGSADYDATLTAIAGEGDREVMALYECLAVEDIQRAADVLRPVYEATRRRDGYVSLEVSPYLAMSTDGTVMDARRLWRAVARDNVMIKVPATRPGLAAIRQLIGDGININITLLFAKEVYEEVAEAYLSGLERLIREGGDPARVASVASFFVSRIDVAVDKLIDEALSREGSGKLQTLAALRGKVAIANAALAYQRHKRLFAGPRWNALEAKGARVQRLLWASTGTKNPDYRDVLYVEELIAPGTVNTLPPATMDAFRDHGVARPTLEAHVEQAERTMAILDSSGISLEAVTARLVVEGVRLFADAFDALLGAVARKRAALLGDKLDGQEIKLPSRLAEEVTASLEAWRNGGDLRRLWAGDARLWTGGDEEKWLGWLGIIGEQSQRLARLQEFSRETAGESIRHIVLLGMGGSSLGPEVIARTFGRQGDGPELLVLDSTDPAQIRALEGGIDLSRTLFVVSSKSGTTLEPNMLKQYFFERVATTVGAERAGSRFIAITDRGSILQQVAERDRFRHIAFGNPSIGGRYSVLSEFGLVPAALMRLDIERLLASAAIMQRSCGPSVPPADNPGVVLGTILGVLAKAGRDKVTIIASPAIAYLGAWLEQLLAESTGKQQRGLVPIDGEPLGDPEAYGQDRLFVQLRLGSECDPSLEATVGALECAGHPVVKVAVRDRYHIGQEFFRWEMATAVAGAILGVNPFDQPDVEASKAKTRALMAAHRQGGGLPRERALLAEHGLEVFADKTNADAVAGGAGTLVACLRAHFDRLRAGDYCALLAYLARTDAHTQALQDIRRIVRDRKRVATCLGFGPRFLHSTGQVYKGGPACGVFLQITCSDADDLKVPEQTYTFGIVKAAQARGDFEVLAERGRRALRVHLGSNVAAGLAALKEAVEQALG
jgi:transaldolase / glucose-6-phosphate isomerase